MQKHNVNVMVLVATLAISGCAYNISPYGVSADNVNTMRSTLSPGTHTVGIERFTSAEPGKNSITCRAAGPVSTPNGKPFETYIEEAFVTELKLAGLYNETTSRKLKGHLTKVDFNSNIGAGKWILEMTLTVNGESIAVTNETPYDASFVADKACQETAQTFPIAVQNLIKAAISNPKFARLASAR